MAEDLAALVIRLSAEGSEKVISVLNSIDASTKKTVTLIKSLQNLLKKVNSGGLEGVRKHMKETTDSTKLFYEAIEVAKGKSSAYVAAISQLGQVYGKTNEAVQRWLPNLKKAEEYIRAKSMAMDAAGRSGRTYYDVMDRVVVMEKMASGQLGATSRAFHQAKPTIDMVTESHKKSAAEVERNTTSYKKATAEVNTHGEGIRNLIPHVALVTLSYMAMRRAVNAVMGTLTIGADFEHQMSIVGGIVRSTTEEFEKLQKAALKAGEETVWTATEAANALRYLGMAGLETEDAIAALGGVLNLALIGEMDLSRATDIATDSLMAFGLNATELDRVVDVFVGTITRSNTNIEALGQAMKFAAPVASQLGYSIEQVSAMIGILSQSGIKSGIAGRALRMSLLRSADAAKELGISSSNLIEILKELNNRNLAPDELAATMHKLFGIEATPSMLILMKNVEALDAFIDTLNNSSGETDAFIKRLDTVTVAWKEVSSVIEDVAITAFIHYADSLKEGLKDLKSWIAEHKEDILGLFSGMISAGKGIAENLVPALNATKEALKSIMGIGGFGGGDVFEIGAAGFIGRLLFGSTPVGAIIAALVTIDKLIANLKMPEILPAPSKGYQELFNYFASVLKAINNIPEIVEGKRDWWTGLPKDVKELRKELGVTAPVMNELAIEVEELYEAVRKEAEEIGKAAIAHSEFQKTLDTHAITAYKNAMAELSQLKWYELLPESEQQTDEIARLKEVAEYEKQVVGELKLLWGSFYYQNEDKFKELVKYKVDGFTKLINEIDKLSQSAEASLDPMGKTVNQAERLEQELAKAATEQVNFNLNLDKLAQEAESTIDPMGKMVNQAERLEQALDKADAELQQFNKDIKKLSKEAEDSLDPMGKMVNQGERLEQALENAKQEVVEFTEKINKLSEEAEASLGPMDKTINQWERMEEILSKINSEKAENLLSNMKKLKEMDKKFSQDMGDLLSKFTNEDYKQQILLQTDLYQQSQIAKLRATKEGSDEAVVIIENTYNKMLEIVKEGLQNQKDSEKWLLDGKKELYKDDVAEQLKMLDEAYANYLNTNGKSLAAFEAYHALRTKIYADAYKDEANALDAAMAEESKWMDGRIDPYVEFEKSQKQYRNDRLQAMKSMYEELGMASTEYYQLLREATELEYEKYIEQLGLKLAAGQAYTQEQLKMLEILNSWKAKKLADPYEDLYKSAQKLFDTTTFGDGQNQSINNLMKSLEELSKMYEEIPKLLKEIEVAQQSLINQDFSKITKSIAESLKDFNLDDFFKGGKLLEDVSFDSFVDAFQKAYEEMDSIEQAYHAETLKRILEEQAARNGAAANIQKAEMQLIAEQLGAYRQLFGATSQLFDENSKEREALHKAEMAFAIAEIIMSQKKNIAIVAGYVSQAFASTASATTQNAANTSTALTGAAASIAAQGPVPIAGFALVGAMVSLMAAVLAIGGIAFGGVGSTTTPNVVNLPQSTVLGADPGTASESIQNSYDMLEDAHALEYAALIDIYNEVKELNQNITGLVTAIIKGVGGDFDQIETANSEWIGGAEEFWNSMTKGMQDLLKLDPLLGWITSFVGGLIGSLVDSIFGGSGWTDIQRIGIAIGGMGQTFADIIAGGELFARLFADIHKHEEGGWFGSDTDDFWTEYKDLDKDAIRLLTKVFKSIGDSFVTLAEGLGVDVQKVYDYIIPVMKLDLRGMSAEQISKAITDFFSNMTDKMAEDLFGDILKQYQKVGEGMYETAVRIVMDMEMVQSVLDMTGKQFNIVATKTESVIEQTIAFSEELIELAGGLEALLEAADVFFTKFLSSTEQQAYLYDQLNGALANYNLELPISRDEYKKLVQSLDLTTESGRKAYIALLQLAGASDAYYSAIEDAQKILLEFEQSLIYENSMETKLRKLRENFKELWEAFALVYHLTSTTGVEIGKEIQDKIDAARKRIEELKKLDTDEITMLRKMIDDLVSGDTSGVTDYFKKMLADLKKLFGSDGDFAKFASEAKQTIFGSIGDIYSQAQLWNQTGWEGMMPSPELSDVAKNADLLKEALSDLSTALQNTDLKSPSILTNFNIAIKATEDYLKSLDSAIAGLSWDSPTYIVEALTSAKQWAESMLPILKDFRDELEALQKTAGDPALIKYIEKILADLGKGDITSALDYLKKKLSDALEKVPDLAPMIDIFNLMESLGKGDFSGAISFFDEIMKGLKDPEAISEMQKILDNLNAGDAASAMAYLQKMLDDLVASGGASAEEMLALLKQIAALEEATKKYVAMQEKQLFAMKVQMGLIDESRAQFLKFSEIMGKLKGIEGMKDMSPAEWIEWFKDANLEQVKAMAKSLGIEWEELAGWIGFLIGYIDEADESIKDFIGGLDDMSNVWKAMDKIWSDFKEKYTDLYKDIEFDPHPAGLKRLIGDFFEFPDEITQEWLDAKREWLKSLSAEELKSIADALGISTSELIKDFLNLQTAMDAIAEKIKQITKWQDELLGRSNQGAIEDFKKKYHDVDVTGKYIQDLIAWVGNMSAHELQNLADLYGVTVDALMADISALVNAYRALEEERKSISQWQASLVGQDNEWTIAYFQKKYQIPFDITEDWLKSYIRMIASMSVEAFQALAAAMGVTTQELRDDINALMGAFDYAASKFADIAQQIRDIMDSIRADIEGLMGTGQTATMIGREIKAILNKPIADLTIEEVLGAAQLMQDWYTAAVKEAQELAETQKEAIQVQIDAKNVDLEALRLELQVADRLESLIDSIEDTIKSIKYSDLNVALPFQKADEAKKDYAALLLAAQTGGTKEVQEYLSFTSEYLSLQQAMYKSSEAYQREYNRVMADLEGIKSKAEAGGYNAAILAEIKNTNAAIEALEAEIKALTESMNAIKPDYTAIEEQFNAWATQIESLITQLEGLQIILNINWTSYTGTMEEALKTLMDLVAIYGWEDEITLKWMIDFSQWIADLESFEDQMTALKFVAGEAGWDSQATLLLVATLAKEGFDSLEEVMDMLNFIVAETGWDSKATLSFIADLNMDSFKTFEDKMSFLEFLVGETGWDSEATLTFMSQLATDGFDSFDDLMDTLQFVAGEAGWDSEAMIQLMGNLNPEAFANFDDTMKLLQFTGENAGWDSEAMVQLIGNLNPAAFASFDDKMKLLQFTGENAGWDSDAIVALAGTLDIGALDDFGDKMKLLQFTGENAGWDSPALATLSASLAGDWDTTWAEIKGYLDEMNVDPAIVAKLGAEYNTTAIWGTWDEFVADIDAFDKLEPAVLASIEASFKEGEWETLAEAQAALEKLNITDPVVVAAIEAQWTETATFANWDAVQAALTKLGTPISVIETIEAAFGDDSDLSLEAFENLMTAAGLSPGDVLEILNHVDGELKIEEADIWKVQTGLLLGILQNTARIALALSGGAMTALDIEQALLKPETPGDPKTSISAKMQEWFDGLGSLWGEGDPVHPFYKQEEWLGENGDVPPHTWNPWTAFGGSAVFDNTPHKDTYDFMAAVIGILTFISLNIAEMAIRLGGDYSVWSDLVKFMNFLGAPHQYFWGNYISIDPVTKKPYTGIPATTGRNNPLPVSGGGGTITFPDSMDANITNTSIAVKLVDATGAALKTTSQALHTYMTGGISLGRITLSDRDFRMLQNVAVGTMAIANINLRLWNSDIFSQVWKYWGNYTYLASNPGVDPPVFPTTSMAEGGIIDTPTYSLIGEAGYPEAVVPMPNGINIPVKWMNGGSTQAGTERPLHITVEVAGKEFYADVQHIARVEADEIRVKANKRKTVDTRRIYT